MTVQDNTIAYQIFDTETNQYVSRMMLANFAHGDFSSKTSKYVWKSPAAAKNAAILLYNNLTYHDRVAKYGLAYYKGKIHKFSEQNRLEIHKMELKFVEKCK